MNDIDSKVTRVAPIMDFKCVFNDPLWLEKAKAILSDRGILFRELGRAEHGENIVVLVDDKYVLKIYRPDRDGYRREISALEFVREITPLPVSRVLDRGNIEGFDFIITDRLPGRLMTRAEWLELDRSAQIGLLAPLAFDLKEMHSADAGVIDFNWDDFISVQLETVIERQRAEGGNPEWVESLPKYIETNRPLLLNNTRSSFLHGDVHFGNLLVTNDLKRPKICGLYDFADSLKGFHEYEFVAVGVLMIQGQGDLQREFFRAYGYKDSELNEEMRRRMMLLTILYEQSSLRRYAERLGNGSEKLTLEELEMAIWNFI